MFGLRANEVNNLPIAYLKRDIAGMLSGTVGTWRLSKLGCDGYFYVWNGDKIIMTKLAIQDVELER